MFHTNLKQISVCIVHKLSLDECPRQKRTISRILNKLQLKCGKIMKFRQKFLKNLKIAVRETLFSEACIWSNICRIWMKSGWSERSISVVFDMFYGVIVGRIVASQFWFDLLLKWFKQRWCQISLRSIEKWGAQIQRLFTENMLVESVSSLINLW